MATVDSANKTKTADEACLAFKLLLEAFPSDQTFLHEVALQTKKASTETQIAFTKAVVEAYRSGAHPELAANIEALETEGTMRGILIYHFSEALVAQPDLVLEAYKTLLAAPAKNVSPYYYEDIASAAAQQIGFREGLALIPNIEDKSFGTAAARDIISSWIYNDPVDASDYLRELPDSEFRNNLVLHLVEKVAESQDFENAQAWANHLDGVWKEKALNLVKQQEDISRQREVQRSEREAQDARK
ncbi:hypothetical protein OKA04_13325 [Luteolibacter flavescens]|uniref:Uncharacterized protein n=1 Tax=Luteolibacter flavescens TaxID=1859460 RepID=A0ABT3FRW2_9BACT|nr:hypothetical protein [Luteolibacter flavescens]MCW1885715.1 hypothetical protein [Luteolibacter flavescens]